jgi:hypothetical protein
MTKQYASEALDTYHEPHIIKMLDETKVCLCCGKILKYLPDKDNGTNRNSYVHCKRNDIGRINKWKN